VAKKWRKIGMKRVFPVAGGWIEMKKVGFKFVPNAQKRNMLLK
jgi:hypothetical protein